MPTSALLLALAAAVVHAAWNLLLSGAEDTHSATAIAVAAGVIVFAPAVAVTWRLEADALPYIAASSALESLYLLLLATGYARAAMSFVYPIARGTSPVLVLAVTALGLGGAVSARAAVGVVLVGVGIVLVRGLRGSGRRSDLVLALGVGACIASYTLVDKHGIVHGAPMSYLELVFAATAAVHLFGTWRVQGAAALRAGIRVSSVVAGIGFFASYALVLAALKLASAASVAAVRESSVLMATAVLALGGRERVTLERLVGSAVVLGGIVLVSLG